MADRIAVMEGGNLLQVGAPREVYNSPASGFVATFLGETTSLRGIVARIDGPLATVRLEAGREVLVRHAGDIAEGQPLLVSIRPERVRVSRERPPEGANALPGAIEFVSYLGSHVVYVIRIEGGAAPLKASEPVPFGAPSFEPGEQVFASWSPEQSVYIRNAA